MSNLDEPKNERKPAEKQEDDRADRFIWSAGDLEIVETGESLADFLKKGKRPQ